MSSDSEPLIGPRPCGIADALQLIGDRWALLAIRELAFGVRRFNEIQQNTGAPRASLATRLRELEAAGIVARRRYSERPPRDEYVLTEAGEALAPALRALREWGERWAAESGSPAASAAPQTARYISK